VKGNPAFLTARRVGRHATARTAVQFARVGILLISADLRIACPNFISFVFNGHLPKNGSNP
jgi:hypothetical protein